MKKYIKTIIPESILKIYRRLNKKLIPVHINSFGFDMYQNSNDIIDYSVYKNQKIDDYKNFVSNASDDFVFFAISNFCKEGSYALDIGSNIGLMSLVMSQKVGPSGKVFSFEPGPISYALLSRNIYKNTSKSNSQIVINNIALTSKNIKVPLFINDEGESDNQVHLDLEKYNFNGEKERIKIFVKGMRLDDYLEENSIDIDRISFIKIDTQGHEMEILKGAQKLINSSSDLKILCEFAPYLKQWESQSIEKFYNLLESFNFKIFDTRHSINKEVNLNYLLENYGFKNSGKYTDLLLIK